MEIEKWGGCHDQHNHEIQEEEKEMEKGGGHGDQHIHEIEKEENEMEKEKWGHNNQYRYEIN